MQVRCLLRLSAARLMDAVVNASWPHGDSWDQCSARWRRCVRRAQEREMRAWLHGFMTIGIHARRAGR